LFEGFQEFLPLISKRLERFLVFQNLYLQLYISYGHQLNMIALKYQCVRLNLYSRVKLVVFFFSFYFIGNGQSDSLSTSLKFDSDFRFRIEQDWNSRKSDGTYRENRSRLRYRFRFGFKYYKSTIGSFTARIRTGLPNKQQDPQLTLGDANKEFSTLPVGIERIQYSRRLGSFTMDLGKIDFPFYRNNELFWSYNVFPEGANVKFNITRDDAPNSIDVRFAHLLMNTNGTSFSKDSYMQGLQINSVSISESLYASLAFYIFRNIPNLPDGAHTFEMPYSIFHIALWKQSLFIDKLSFEFDFYRNLEDYSDFSQIDQNLRDQKSSVVFALSYGKLEKPKSWMIKATYAYIERFAALDYMSQNDWARWDYNNVGSPDGRLSNLEGVELALSYKLNDAIRLSSKYYTVDQLEAVGMFKENGQRWRLDLDVRF